MFTCNHGAPHQHSTADEARICWGLKAPAPGPVVNPALGYRDRPGTMSRAQERYLRDLGATASELYAGGVRISSNKASALIERYKRSSAMASATPPAAPPDPRIGVLQGMIDLVPDGYFAVTPDATVAPTFLRLSTPRTGKYKGSRKVQTQHGPRLEVEAYFPTWGTMRVYRQTILDHLLLLVADYQGSALRYSSIIGKCCRCNAALTDERSRYYGIGPECEKIWEWVIPRVESVKGPYVPAEEAYSA